MEGFRYDQFWEYGPKGRELNSYDGGKGIELIPAQNIDVILGVPAYQTRDKLPASGDPKFSLRTRVVGLPGDALGPGKPQLSEAIAKTGSLRYAAEELEMSYMRRGGAPMP
jgi:hypothetical protein